MTFKQYSESNEFSDYSKKELEILLKHHKDDLEEYKNDDKTTAKESSIKDIKQIEDAIKAVNEMIGSLSEGKIENIKFRAQVNKAIDEFKRNIPKGEEANPMFIKALKILQKQRDSIKV